MRVFLTRRIITVSMGNITDVAQCITYNEFSLVTNAVPFRAYKVSKDKNSSTDIERSGDGFPWALSPRALFD